MRTLAGCQAMGTAALLDAAASPAATGAREVEGYALAARPHAADARGWAMVDLAALGEPEWETAVAFCAYAGSLLTDAEVGDLQRAPGHRQDGQHWLEADEASALLRACRDRPLAVDGPDLPRERMMAGTLVGLSFVRGLRADQFAALHARRLETLPDPFGA
jgi:hypothetical protein